MLPEPRAVSGIRLSARLEKPLDYGGKPAGASGADDFPLRIGLVIAGPHRLRPWNRWLAPSWLKKLHRIAPPDSGIESIQFLNFGDGQTPPVFKSRQHPSSRFFQEKIVGAFQDGDLDRTINLEQSYDVIGLWISCDGDDTNSTYTVRIRNLELLP